MTSARYFAVLTLSFSVVHVGINEAASGSDECFYDGAFGLGMSVSTFVLFAFCALYKFREEWRERALLLRDAIGIVPGIWFQITVKPETYFAAVPSLGCDMRSSGYAMAMWLLGEILTFGAAVRLLPRLGFGARFAPTMVLGAIMAAMVGIVDMVARALRE